MLLTLFVGQATGLIDGLVDVCVVDCPGDGPDKSCPPDCEHCVGHGHGAGIALPLPAIDGVRPGAARSRPRPVSAERPAEPDLDGLTHVPRAEPTPSPS